MKPISKTAFYCTGVRALDARSPRPICGDVYAERFMDEEAWRIFEPFRGFRAPNASNAARHRILDDLLRARLAADPERRIAIVGAGFDSRAFRLAGGRWVEADEPQVFAWKEPRLPAADCPNRLARVAVDFAAERLEERLAPYADERPATVVVEGVLMYLAEEEIRALLRALRSLYPRLEVACDVMTNEFFEKFARPIHAKIRGLGASFRLPATPIAEIFRQEGLPETSCASVVGRAKELGAVDLPTRILFRLSRTFREGYSIRTFGEPAAAR